MIVQPDIPKNPAQALAYYARLRELYRRDFALYAREALWIETKLAGKIATLDISQKPLQTMAWKACQEQIREWGYIDLDIIKGRQQGSSAFSQGVVFASASLTPNFNTLLIAQDPATTAAIFEKARFFYEHLPPWLKPQIRKSNMNELFFAAPDSKRRIIEDHGLNSRMTFQAAQKMNAGTGLTRQGLHLSECAKFTSQDIGILVSSLYPIIYRGPGSIRIKESTAFPQPGAWFKECCEEARDGRTRERLIFVPAYLEPDNVIPLDRKNPDDRDLGRMVGLDAEEQRIVKVAKKGQKKYNLQPFEIRPEYLKFRRVTIAQPGWDEELYAQEYPLDFESAWISRDTRVFNFQKLEQLKKKHVQHPKRLMSFDWNLRKFVDDHTVRYGPEESYLAIWEDPILGESYDIGADVAAGLEGGDWSAAPIWKRRNREQVGELHIHMDPSDFGAALHQLGTWYFNAQMSVETTGGYGISTETQLKRLSYPNLAFWKLRGEIVPKATRKTGWSTTRESKAFLVSYWRYFINHDRVIVRSMVMLNELYQMIQLPYGDGYDYHAEIGHDDLFMGGGIGLIISDDENLGRMDEIRDTKQPVSVHNIALQDDWQPESSEDNPLLMEIRGNY